MKGKANSQKKRKWLVFESKDSRYNTPQKNLEEENSVLNRAEDWVLVHMKQRRFHITHRKHPTKTGYIAMRITLRVIGHVSAGRPDTNSFWQK